MWFVDKADYARIGSGDILETVGLADLLNGAPKATIKIKVSRRNGDAFEILTNHTMSTDQLRWFEAGSALNYIRSKLAEVR